MPANPPATGKGGLGQRIIRMMTTNLGAGLDHDASHKGTRIVIDIPVERDGPATASGETA